MATSLVREKPSAEVQLSKTNSQLDKLKSLGYSRVKIAADSK